MSYYLSLQDVIARPPASTGERSAAPAADHGQQDETEQDA